MKLFRVAVFFAFSLLLAGCGNSTTKLTGQLKSADAVARLHAVHALRHRTKEAKTIVPALIDTLTDKDTTIRRDAARALATYGDKANDAIPALREMATNDPEPSVRRAAAQSIGRIEMSASRKTET